MNERFSEQSVNHNAVIACLDRFKIEREKHTHKRWLRFRALNSLISSWSNPWGARLIERTIAVHLENCRSLIDVAVGTDELIFQLASYLPDDAIIVANDLDYQAIDYLKTLAPSGKVKFLNKDIRDLATTEQFDCAIAKCVLHHANTVDVLRDFLSAVQKIANRVILVDIEDPFKSSWRAFWWHVLWYRAVLLDDGGTFFVESEFQKLIASAYPNAEVKFERIPAFKGTYMLARVDF